MKKETIKFIVSIIIVLLIIFFCGKWLWFSNDSKKIENNKIYQDSISYVDSLTNVNVEDSLIKEFNDKEIEKLKNKYNLISDFKTKRRQFTANYQELFKDTSKYLAFKGDVIDIVENNGIYILKLSSRGNVLKIRNLEDFDAFVADVNVSSKQFEKLNNVLKDTTTSLLGVFILKINKIILLNPKVEMNNSEKEDDQFYYLDFENSSILLKSELIDYYLNKRNIK